MIQIVRSLSIVTAISAFIGFCGYLLNLNFFALFGIAFVGQFMLFNIFNSWRKSKFELEFRRLENDRIKAYSEQGLEVTCPVENCMHKTFVPIVVSEDNEYDCPKCNVGVKIYVGTKTFLKTTPIAGDPFEKHNFVTNTDYDD